MPAPFLPMFPLPLARRLYTLPSTLASSILTPPNTSLPYISHLPTTPPPPPATRHTPHATRRPAPHAHRQNSFRHLPVMEDDGTVVGIISNRDVTTQLLKLSDAQKEYFLEYVPFDLW